MEFKIIHDIQKQFQNKGSLIQGIGDDCAVLPKDEQTVYLVSTDCLVENVHFSFDYFSWADLGYKALAVNISDVNAMGGKAEHAFVSLAVPKGCAEEHIQEFYKGFSELTQKEGVTLAGGDLSASLESVFVNVTIVGEASQGSVKYRSGAKVGDSIFVCGDLGWSAKGLELLKQNPNDDSKFSLRHKRPQLHSKTAHHLGQDQRVHAMIDVSDGLLQDLQHMCQASHVGANLDLSKLEYDPQIHFGEDYALLVVGDLSLENDFPELVRMGDMVEGQQIQSGSKVITPQGFTHF